MVTIHESSDPLTEQEEKLYDSHLQNLGLDKNIWHLFARFLQVKSKYSQPRILRIQNENKQLGHFYVLRCKDYGESLSKYSFVHRLTRKYGFPVYSWMRSSICAENCANPGFSSKNPDENIFTNYLKELTKHFFMLFILDLERNSHQYPGSLELPYVDEGIVETDKYTTIDDYKHEHRNLKKKLREYRHHGGRIDILKGQLSFDLQEKVEKSVWATSQYSLYHLPYQELYPAMCKSSSDIDNEKFIHFLCQSAGHFFGYHSFMQFNNQLRCLNGAFNRDLRTTYHAYENMIYTVVSYAIENRIKSVYFGPILNETKKRMMNRFLPTKIYVYSKFPLFLKLFSPLLRGSGMMPKELYSFSNVERY